MTVVKYLMGQLGIRMGEWKELSEKDRKDLKEAAAAEMAARGIPVKV